MNQKIHESILEIQDFENTGFWESIFFSRESIDLDESCSKTCFFFNDPDFSPHQKMSN